MRSFKSYANLRKFRPLHEQTQEELKEMMKQEERSKLPNQIDEKTFKKLDMKLSRCKYRMYKELPFFGLILARLKTVITRDLPTMGVDGDGNIYINPEFALEDLSEDEVMGVLAHETFHIANLTLFRARGRNHKLWNVATDYIMNRDLVIQGLKLPPMGCIPKPHGDTWVVETKIGDKQVAIDVTDSSAEQLYAELVKHIKKESGKGKGGKGQPGSGQGGAGGGMSMGDILDELGDLQEELDKHLEGKGNTPEAAKGSQDSNNGVYKPNEGKSGPGSEAAREAKIKAIVQGAVESAKKMRGGGLGMPRSFNMKMYEPKTDWRTILKDFITANRSSRYDMGRPNRRALASGYYAPRRVEVVSEVTAVVAIDTSGSISDAILNTFFNEIRAIYAQYPDSNLTMLFWHTNVYAKVNLEEARDIDELFKVKIQSGGTTLSSIADYINKDVNIEDVDSLLIFTDGYVEDNPRLPVTKNRPIFMLNGDGSTDAVVKKYGDTYTVDVPLS